MVMGYATVKYDGASAAGAMLTWKKKTENWLIIIVQV